MKLSASLASLTGRACSTSRVLESPVTPGFLMDEARIEELLELHVEARRRGEMPSPEALCDGDPELAGELARRLALLRRFEDFLHPPEETSGRIQPVDPTGPTISFSGNTFGSEALLADLPGYRIAGEIGRGGMGVVFKAQAMEGKLKGRWVALKVILAGDRASPVQITRFHVEAETLARLEHPNIVRVHSAGEHQGLPYLVMELLDGGTLAEQIRGGPLPATQCAKLVGDLAQAIAEAHRLRVIHRDLKPANVLMTAGGLPKISDFGLAKRLDDAGELTHSGDVLGSPAYMAPEQAAGRIREIGPATDVYALGAILYACLTGLAPFRGANSFDVLLQVIGQPPVPPRRVADRIPPDLETICLRCLEKEPGQRYAGALDLAEELRRFLAGDAIQRPATAWERLELELYWKNLALAEREWSSGHPHRMDSPLAACPPGLRGWEWHCLRGLRDGLATRLPGHADVVYSLAFSKDGRFLASTSDDQTIRVLNQPDGSLHRVIDGHTDQIYATCFSPDGRFLAGASQERVIKVWDMATGGPPRILEGHEDVVVGVAFSPDGRVIASASDDRTVRLWDSHDGTQLRVLVGHGDMVNSVAFSPDGTLVASASHDGRVILWDREKGSLKSILAGHSGFVWTVAFSPDGGLLASGGGDRIIRLWDTVTGRAIGSLAGHTGVVWSLAFHPAGTRLASGSWDRTARVWDVRARQEALTLRGHLDSVNAVAFSADGDRLASAGDDRMVLLWDATPHPTPARLVRKSLGRAETPVHCVTFSPDGGLLASAGDDHHVRIWDSATASEVRVLGGHQTLVTAVAFSQDGRWVAGAGADKTLRVWDARTGSGCFTLRGHTDRIYGVAFSPDGRFLASGGWDRTVRLWETATGRQARVLSGHTNWIWQVAFSPDGRLLASASTDRTIRIWPVDTVGEPQVLMGHDLKTQGVAFHPDGIHLASASGDQTIGVWELTTGTQVRRLRGHTERVQKVAFHPGGDLLASAGEDQCVRLWDWRRGETVHVLRGHSLAVTSVAFSSHGKLLASAGDDGSIHLWDLDGILESGEPSRPITPA